MEEHKLGEKIFPDVNARLEAAGLIMHGGTVVDATLIAAPTSAKTMVVNVILRCIRLKRVMNGTLE